MLVALASLLSAKRRQKAAKQKHHCKADKYKQCASEIADCEECRAEIIMGKEAETAPPPNKRAKYKQTRAYAYTYLASQYALVVVAATGIILAICNLKGLNVTIAQQALADRPVLLPQPVSAVDGGAQPTIINFGKTIARNVIVPGKEVWAPSGESEPFDADCREDGPPLTNLYVTVLAPEQQDIAPQLWKLAAPPSEAGEVLYAVGCVYYAGLDGTRYYTDICTKLTGRIFVNCDSRERNYVH